MSATTPKLTCELITMLAKILIADDAMASCANLNLASKKVREATLEVLWTNMYWTAYHDPATYNKAEVEAKWKIFKKSRGAKYIKFMIEPCLFKCNTGYGEDPQISKSLSKTLKASIALVTCAGQREIQVHLFAKFGYTQADKEQVSEALRVAKSFPSFQSGTDVSVYIHSKLPTPIPTETSAGQTINAAGGSASTRNMHAPAVTGQPNAVTPSLFQSVSLRIDKSIIMKDLDEAAYNTLTSYASSFIRPYATERMTAAEPGEPASFVMGGPKISMLVAFGQAWMRLWERDPFYTTFEISLYLPYDEETGKPFPTPKQQGELYVLHAHAKKHIKVAAQTIPLRLLGGFHSSNHRETVYADARVDAKNKTLRSMFGLGYNSLERKEEALHDVEAAAD